MPRIPTYTAGERKIQVPTTSGAPPYVDPAAGLANLPRAVDALADLTGKLVEQRRDSEYVKLTGIIDELLARMPLELAREPEVNQNPANYAPLFKERTTNAVNRIVDTIEDPEVKRRMAPYIDSKMRAAWINADAEQRQRIIVSELGRLVRDQDDLAMAAAGAATPTERNEKIGMWNARLEASQKRGFINEKERAKLEVEFKNKVETNFLTIMARTNVPLMLEMLEQGAFDGVEPSRRIAIVDAAVKRHQSVIDKAERAKEDAMKQWRESVVLETERHAAARTLTQDWLDENKYALGSSKVAALSATLRKQQLGIDTGSPEVERAFALALGEAMASGNVNNVISAQASLNRLYAADLISHDVYIAQSDRVRSVINQMDDNARSQRSEARAVRGEARAIDHYNESRDREQRKRHYDTAMTNIVWAFRVTDKFQNFDQVVTTAAGQFREELQRRGRYHGGTEDELTLYYELLPRYIANASEQATARVKQLRASLLYPTVEALKEAHTRGVIGPEEYESQLEIMRQIKGITNHVELLQSQGRLQRPTTGERK